MLLSVILCTHNPRPDYLQRVLAGLRAQTLGVDQWEFLLIDNASAESVSSQVDLSWHSAAQVVVETEVGLTRARLRGIRESRGHYLLFLDDDNVLREDYLHSFLSLATIHRQLGCLGAGYIMPDYEEEPDLALAPYLSSLALRSSPVARWSNDPTDSFRPWGAGLGVTRAVAKGFARSCVGSALTEGLGRTGTSLVSGEDDEFSWQACAQGLGRGYFPELHLTHLIPARRVRRPYLLQLARGQAYSDRVLDYVHGRETFVPPEPARLRDALWAVFTAHLSVALSCATSWWGWRNKPLVEREFADARRSGLLDANAMLAKQYELEARAGEVTP